MANCDVGFCIQAANHALYLLHRYQSDVQRMVEADIKPAGTGAIRMQAIEDAIDDLHTSIANLELLRNRSVRRVH